MSRRDTRMRRSRMPAAVAESTAATERFRGFRPAAAGTAERGSLGAVMPPPAANTSTTCGG